MQITVNGHLRNLPEECTGAQLLESVGLPSSTTVSEVNGTIVPRGQFLDMKLAAGDIIELVTVVGGG